MTEPVKEKEPVTSTEILPSSVSQEQAVAMIRNPMLMHGDYTKRIVYAAKTYFESGLLPSSIKNAQAAMVVMMKGIEVGFGAMESFSHIHVISGKPTLSAEGMKNLVHRNCPDATIDFDICDDTKCTITGKKPKHKPMTVTFTIEDAKRAELMGNPTWKKYPRAMLRSRALTELIRSYFSEFTAGIQYCPEELGAIVNESGEPINVTPEDQKPRVSQRQAKELLPVVEAQPTPSIETPPEPGSFADFTPGVSGVIVPQGNIYDKSQNEAGPDDIVVPEEPKKPIGPPADAALLGKDIVAALWGEIKLFFKGDAIKAKKFCGEHMGAKPSLEWNMGDYKKSDQRDERTAINAMNEVQKGK